MKTATLLTCDSSVEANLIKGRLENEGIPSFVTNENFSNLLPNYNRILNSGVQVIVNKSDLSKAILVLELERPKELVCPKCNSNKIRLVMGKKWFKKFVIILTSLLNAVPINNINTINRCKACNYEF